MMLRIKTSTLKPTSPIFPLKSKQKGDTNFSFATLSVLLLVFLSPFFVFSMEDLRSRSYADGRMQIEPYGIRGAPVPSYDLRSYSTSDASSYSQKENKLNKSKNLSSFKGGGWLNDPELQRKKRVAGYKVYSVEGKVKGSFRKSFRWIKDRYTHAVYGWW